MKKTTKLFGFIAIVAMAVVGCSKEIDAPQEIINEEAQENVVETHTVTITAGSPETKTSIVEDASSASFKWSSDDATRFHIFENEVEGSSIALETTDEYVTVKLTATFATVSAASYTYNAFLAKNVYNDDYPQIPSAQTCTGSSYDPNADILVAKSVTNEGDVLDKLNMQFGRPCVINKMTLKGLTAGETLTTVEINSDKALTGYYDIEGKEWTDESKRIILTTSQVVPASGEVVVYFVTKPVDAATLTVTAITDVHVYDKTFTKTINFVFNQVTVFGVSGLAKYTRRDVVTRPLTGVADNAGYTAFSAKSYSGAGKSNAVYAGTIAGGNHSIQINANSGSSYRGIVTTASGGSLMKVRVTWNTNTTNTRALTVYGKNVAYTTADLNDSWGTEIGSITKGSTVELAVASYYEYVMLKSTAAIYLDEIVLFWGDAKTASGLKWTADGSAGDAVSAAGAEMKTGDDDMPAAALYNPNGIGLGDITFTSSDTNVATIGEHTGVITLVGEGDTEIHAVFAGNSTYTNADVHYTLSVSDGRTAPVITLDESDENRTTSNYDGFTGRTATVSPAVDLTYSKVDANSVIDEFNTSTGALTLTGTAGSATVTVSYAGSTEYKAAVSKSYTIIVADPSKSLSSISITGQTTSFNKGDSFSFGGTVTAHYTDASTSDVTASSSFSGYNMSTPGAQTVTVSYTEGGVTRTTTYDIVVYTSAVLSYSTFTTAGVSLTTTATSSDATKTIDGISVTYKGVSTNSKNTPTASGASNDSEKVKANQLVLFKKSGAGYIYNTASLGLKKIILELTGTTTTATSANTPTVSAKASADADYSNVALPSRVTSTRDLAAASGSTPITVNTFVYEIDLTGKNFFKIVTGSNQLNVYSITVVYSN